MKIYQTTESIYKKIEISQKSTSPTIESSVTSYKTTATTFKLNDIQIETRYKPIVNELTFRCVVLRSRHPRHPLPTWLREG